MGWRLSVLYVCSMCSWCTAHTVPDSSFFLTECPGLQCRSIAGSRFFEGWSSSHHRRIFCHLPPPVPPPPAPRPGPPLLPTDYLLWATLATLTSLIPFLFVGSYVTVRRCGRFVQSRNRCRAAATQTTIGEEGDACAAEGEDDTSSSDEEEEETVVVVVS